MSRKTKRNLKKNFKRKGGMISRAASSIAQTAALEYAQRRGPQIFKSGIQNPENLKDPSIYLTGKKSPTLQTTFNTNLIKPKPIRFTPIPLNKPILYEDENDENSNPNIMKAGRSRRHKKVSKKTRKGSN